MDGTHVRVTWRGPGVVTVLLDRPPLNALDLDLMDDIAGAAAMIRAEPDARVVVLESSSPLAFMVGADLHMVEAHLDEVEVLMARLRAALDAWARLPVPTIACIAGHTLGGGCELALACDFRLMAQGEPRIGLPEIRRGLLPAGGGTQRLPRLVGRGPALDLLLRGRTLDADEAAKLGLVTAACTPDEIGGHVASLADELVALPRVALAEIKAAVADGAEVPLHEGLDLEAAAMARVARTPDAMEGVRSFLERREPRFAT